MRWNQKYDSTKMFSLVEEYLSGGIMQKDLCQRESIKKGTFKYWQRKYREESKANSSKKTSKKVIISDFIPISVPVVAVPSSCELELVYPNGVRLHLNTVMDATGLSTLKELVLCLD
jgi:transposase-like protein